MVHLTPHRGEERPCYPLPLFPLMKTLRFLHLDRVVLQVTTHCMTPPLMRVVGTGEIQWGTVMQTSTTLVLHQITREDLLTGNPSELVLHFQREALLLHRLTILQTHHGRITAVVPHSSQVSEGVLANSNRQHLQAGSHMRCLPEGSRIRATEVRVSMITEAISRDFSVTVIPNLVV